VRSLNVNPDVALRRERGRTFDLRQEYLEFQSRPVTASAGRQQLRFGDERLIGISHWTNVSRTVDVIHARLWTEQNGLDLFNGSVVRIFPTSFDRPTGDWYMLCQGESLHAATTRDSIYNDPGAALIAPTAGHFKNDELGRSSMLQFNMRPDSTCYSRRVPDHARIARDSFTT
jgi:hypothetical protein